MKTGGIYPALKRLAQWKFVQKADDDRYELTDQGRDVLAQELDRLNLVVQLGRHRLARKQSHSNATLIMEILPD